MSEKTQKIISFLCSFYILTGLILAFVFPHSFLDTNKFSKTLIIYICSVGLAPIIKYCLPISRENHGKNLLRANAFLGAIIIVVYINMLF